MKKMLPCLAVLGALSLGALPIRATDLFDEVYITSGSQSKDSSFSDIPSGAEVIVEASSNGTGSAYSHAYGGGIGNGSGITVSVSGQVGGSDWDFTHYADTIGYDLSVNGLGYAFVEIDY